MTDVETRRGYSHYHVSETAWQCRTEYLENSAVCRILNGYSLFIWFLLDVTSQLQNVGLINELQTPEYP